MRLSITVIAADTQVSNDFIQIEVFPDMTLDDVKGFVQAEINVPPPAQNYILNDQIITQTSRKLVDLGINDGDILSLAIQTKPQGAQRRPQAESSQQRPAQRQRSGPDPEMLRLQVLADPRLQADLRAQDAEMADALNDSARFAQIWDQRARQQVDAQREKEEMLSRLNDDPFNAEAQGKIEEMIRQERVMENMQKAYEENPESFGHVTMLYIDVFVNNVPIKAFVDSGAQTTIMSPSAAERCGIMRLIDRRFAGVARGVGTAQILGRVHSAEIQIGQYSLASSFTVMEGKDVDLLLGLDMLKRHQMCVDLKENCLRISGQNIPFLPESEIPKSFEERTDKEAKVQGPGGTTIGTETGTVAGPSTAASSSTTASKVPATITQAPTSRINIHPQGSAGHITSTRPQAPANAPATTTATPSAPARPGQPAVPAPTGSAQQSNPFGSPAPVTEQSIAQVMELGFSREEAVAALQQVQGNVELAIGLLL